MGKNCADYTSEHALDINHPWVIVIYEKGWKRNNNYGKPEALGPVGSGTDSGVGSPWAILTWASRVSRSPPFAAIDAHSCAHMIYVTWARPAMGTNGDKIEQGWRVYLGDMSLALTFRYAQHITRLWLCWICGRVTLGRHHCIWDLGTTRCPKKMGTWDNYRAPVTFCCPDSLNGSTRLASHDLKGSSVSTSPDAAQPAPTVWSFENLWESPSPLLHVDLCMTKTGRTESF